MYNPDVKHKPNLDPCILYISAETGLKDIKGRYIKMLTGTDISWDDDDQGEKQSLTDEQIEKYVSSINSYASVNSSSWIFNELVNTDSGYEVRQYSNVVQWLDNIGMEHVSGWNSGVIQIYDDFKENGTWKYVNFSLTLSDDSERHFIVKSENEKWNLYPFNSAPEYNSLMNLLKSVTPISCL